MAYRKRKDRHKRERSKDRDGNEGRRRFRPCKCVHMCIQITCFIMTALEQPRRVSDLHTPAKHLALAYVFVTFWVTLRTSLPGREITF